MIEYTSRKNGEKTKEYISWRNLLNRVTSEKELIKFPTYRGCSIIEGWYNFQNFAKWFNENYIEGFVLDKDILFKGNKIYGPDTCCFVPEEINGLFIKRQGDRGNLPIGIYLENPSNKYKSQISINGKRKNLGRYNTIEEAFQIYKVTKENHIKELANKYKNIITNECYDALINYKVEITD